MRVGQEIMDGAYEPGTWAQALAAAKGNRELAIADYATRRMEGLTQERNEAASKRKQMESRRLNSCYGVRTVQDILKGMGGSAVLNLPRPKLAFIWMLLLLVGTAGSFAALSKLSMISIPETMNVPILSLGLGIMMVLVTKMLGLFLSPFTLRWVWGQGLVAVCAASCITSMLLGAKLMMINPNDSTLHSVLVRITPGVSHGDVDDSDQPIAAHSIQGNTEMPTQVSLSESNKAIAEK